MRAFIMRHPRAGQRVRWGFPHDQIPNLRSSV
jgi:hypothetical protein